MIARAHGGVGLQHITKGELESMLIPLPPLAEQKRIVAKVDQLMALCDDLEAKQTKKRDLATQSTRSALTALTTAESPQEFTTAWTRVLETWPVILDLPEKVGEVRKAVLDLAIRGSYSSKHSGGPDSRGVPLNADDSASCSDRYGSSDELQNIPKDWPRRSFREIVAFSQVGIDRGRAEQGAGRRFSYVKMNNITADGQYNDSDLTRIDASDEEVSRYSLRHGDFLFNTRNSAELVGKACVFAPMSKEPHLFNNNILQVRFVDEVDPQFVVYWLGSSPGRALLERRKSATTNVAAIYQGQLMTVPVPIPTLSEQKRIVAKVGQLKRKPPPAWPSPWPPPWPHEVTMPRTRKIDCEWHAPQAGRLTGATRLCSLKRGHAHALRNAFLSPSQKFRFRYAGRCILTRQT
jgi:type I restriction enzyme S subunit